MSIIEKIGITWLVLICVLISVCLGLIAFICPFVIVSIILIMISIGGIGWCIYQTWNIWHNF